MNVKTESKKLSREFEAACAARIAAGDNNGGWDLAQAAEGLVGWIVNRYSSLPGVDREDLISEATVAAFKFATRLDDAGKPATTPFDATKGRFAAVAEPRIRREILRYLAATVAPVAIPEWAYLASLAKERPTGQTGAGDAWAWRHHASLEAPAGGEDAGAKMGDLLPSAAPSVERIILALHGQTDGAKRRQYARDLVGQLPTSQRRVMTAVLDRPAETDTQIGTALELSRAGVTQQRNRAMVKLRELTQGELTVVA